MKNQFYSSNKSIREAFYSWLVGLSDEELSFIMNDPDEGLELKDEVKDRLRKYIAPRGQGR